MRYLILLILAGLLWGCETSRKADLPAEGKGTSKKMVYDTTLLGGIGLDNANYIIPVSSGGYLVAGYFAGSGEDNFHGALVRLDNNNKVLWSRKYRENGYNRAWSVCETPDGQFMVTGFTDSFEENSKFDVWLFRTDANGQLLWEKYFGGHEDDLAWDIKRTEDGNYVIAAQTWSKGNGNFDAWIIKFDGKGEILWESVIGTEGRERVFSIDQGTKGEIYATGIYTPGPAKGPIDVYTICVDSKNGDVIWEDKLDKGKDDTGHGVIKDKNGGIWVTGYTTSLGAGGQDGFLLRYGKNGNLTDFHTYGSTGDDRIMNVVHGSKNDLWLIGYSNSYSENFSFDMWMTQTNSNGDSLATYTMGGPGFDRGVHMISDENKVIAVGSYAPPSKMGDSDLIILNLK